MTADRFHQVNPAASGSNPKKSAARSLEFTLGSKRPLSCAECRRLKRRCNREWPCKPCIERGCAAICPEGTLATVDAATAQCGLCSEQQVTIKHMSDRVAQLENALAMLWTGEGTHPLLRRDSSYIHDLSPFGSKETSPDPEEDELGSITQELGTLRLDSKGNAIYMGRSAKIEYLLDVKREEGEDGTLEKARKFSSIVDGTSLTLPQPILAMASKALMMGSPSPEIDLTMIRQHLPLFDRALQLTEIFYENAAWFYCPVSKRVFLQDYLYPAYGMEYVSDAPCPGNSRPNRDHDAHKLALVYYLFSLAATLDPNLEPINHETETLRVVALAAMVIQTACEGCSMSLLRAMLLGLHGYVHWAEAHLGKECVWFIMGSISKITLTLGLHRDGEHWGDVHQDEVDDRRGAYWNFLMMEIWQCLGYGRPPSVNLNHVDTKLPYDPTEERDAKGRVIRSGFENKLLRFGRDCMWLIVENAFDLNRKITYQAIMDIDSKIRNFDAGELTGVAEGSKNWALQQYILNSQGDHALLHIHRVYFMRALVAQGDNPLESPYSRSVMATFKSATVLLDQAREIFRTHPVLASRLWLMPTYVLQAALAMASICERGPRSSLAPLAFLHLNTAVVLLESNTNYNKRLEGFSRAIKKFQNQASESIASVGPGPSAGLYTSNGEDGRDAMAIYGGSSRIIRAEPQPPDDFHKQYCIKHAAELAANSDPAYAKLLTPDFDILRWLDQQPPPPQDLAMSSGDWMQGVGNMFARHDYSMQPDQSSTPDSLHLSDQSPWENIQWTGYDSQPPSEKGYPR